MLYVDKQTTEKSLSIISIYEWTLLRRLKPNWSVWIKVETCFLIVFEDTIIVSMLELELAVINLISRWKLVSNDNHIWFL